MGDAGNRTIHPIKLAAPLGRKLLTRIGVVLSAALLACLGAGCDAAEPERDPPAMPGTPLLSSERGLDIYGPTESGRELLVQRLYFGDRDSLVIIDPSVEGRPRVVPGVSAHEGQSLSLQNLQHRGDELFFFAWRESAEEAPYGFYRHSMTDGETELLLSTSYDASLAMAVPPDRSAIVYHLQTGGGSAEVRRLNTETGQATSVADFPYSYLNARSVPTIAPTADRVVSPTDQEMRVLDLRTLNVQTVRYAGVLAPYLHWTDTGGGFLTREAQDPFIDPQTVRYYAFDTAEPIWTAVLPRRTAAGTINGSASGNLTRPITYDPETERLYFWRWGDLPTLIEYDLDTGDEKILASNARGSSISYTSVVGEQLVYVVDNRPDRGQSMFSVALE